MNANYTTKTATLKTVTHDSHIITTNKLFVNQKTDNGEIKKVSIIDLIKSESAKEYFDDRGENVTPNDLWGNTISVENETIRIQHSLLSGNNYCAGLELTNVIADDDKIKDVNKQFSSNVQFENIVDGTKMFADLESVSIDCNFNNLEIGELMFANSTIKHDLFDLPSLKRGTQMYYNSTLSSNVYSKTLDKLIDGNAMFDGAKNLNYFFSNIPYCCNGYKMFNETGLYEFRGATTYLYDGRQMFSNTNLKNITSDFSSLISGLGMFENTDLSKSAIENIAKSIPSLTKTTTITSTETDENGELVDELVNIFENGVSFKYICPTWNSQTNKISNLTSTLKIEPNEVGIITITWKNPGAIDPADALIIEREYFKLMNIKGWTVVTNLRENENGTRFTREINGITSTGTLVLGPKAVEWQEITIN